MNSIVDEFKEGLARRTERGGEPEEFKTDVVWLHRSYCELLEATEPPDRARDARQAITTAARDAIDRATAAGCVKP